MHYLVKLDTRRSGSKERLTERDDVYLTPKGETGWAIVEAEDEESLRRSFGAELEEATPLLLARGYLAVHETRGRLEDLKSRFVDDPSGALAEARRSVGRAMEELGYAPAGRADESSEARQEVLREYRSTEVDESASLEEKRSAFNRLSGILDSLVRT